MTRYISRLCFAALVLFCCGTAITLKVRSMRDRFTDETFYYYADGKNLLSNDLSLPISDAALSFIPKTRLWGRPLNINGPFSSQSLNIYVVDKPERFPATNQIRCNCLTSPKQNTIYCDRDFIDAATYSFDPRPSSQSATDDEAQEMMLQFANLRSSSILLWLIGHEIGHVQFRHDLVVHGSLGIIDEAQGIPTNGLQERLQKFLDALRQSKPAEKAPIDLTLKSLRDVENQADQFVIDNIPRNQVGPMHLDLFNFSGLLNEYIHPGLKIEERIISPYNPAYHPDLDYRAMLMAEHINQNSSFKDPYYDKVFSRYQLVPEEKPTSTACNLTTSFMKGQLRRQDINSRQIYSLSLVYEIIMKAIAADPSQDDLSSLIQKLGIFHELTTSDVSWLKSWLMAVRAYTDPTDTYDVDRLAPKMAQSETVGPENVPAYFRLARMYLDYQNGLIPITEPHVVSVLSELFQDQSMTDLVETVQETLERVLADENSDRETMNALVVMEAIEFTKTVLTLRHPPAQAGKLFWTLINAEIARKKDGKSYNVTYPLVVHTSVLRYRVPAAFHLQMEERLARAVTTVLSRELELAPSTARVQQLAELLQLGQSAESSPIEEAVIDSVEGACQRTASDACDDTSWLSQEVRSLIDSRDVAAAVHLARRKPTALWNAISDNPDVLHAIESSLRDNVDLYPEWLDFLRSVPDTMQSDNAAFKSIPCDVVHVGSSIGVQDAAALAACQERVKNATGIDCGKAFESGTPESACEDVVQAFMEDSVLKGQHDVALSYMNYFEKLATRGSGAVFDGAGTSVLISRRLMSWNELKASLQNRGRND